MTNFTLKKYEFSKRNLLCLTQFFDFEPFTKAGNPKLTYKNNNLTVFLHYIYKIFKLILYLMAGVITYVNIIKTDHGTGEHRIFAAIWENLSENAPILSKLKRI
jgi:hypothetical protein